MDTRTGWFIALVLFLALGIVGNMDYRDAKLIEAEKKMGAPIYSKRCERQGKQILAVRSDAGEWTVHCVDATVKL